MSPPRKKQRMAPLLSQESNQTCHNKHFRLSAQAQLTSRCNGTLPISLLIPHVFRLMLVQSLIRRRASR